MYNNENVKELYFFILNCTNLLKEYSNPNQNILIVSLGEDTYLKQYCTPGDKDIFSSDDKKEVAKRIQKYMKEGI